MPVDASAYGNLAQGLLQSSTAAAKGILENNPQLMYAQGYLAAAEAKRKLSELNLAKDTLEANKQNSQFNNMLNLDKFKYQQVADEKDFQLANQKLDLARQQAADEVNYHKDLLGLQRDSLNADISFKTADLGLRGQELASNISYKDSLMSQMDYSRDPSNPENVLKQAQAKLALKEASAGPAPFSAEGKLAADLANPALAATLPAVLAASKNTGEAQYQNFKQENNLRQDYLGQTKDFGTITDAYNKITRAAAQTSAAGDMAVIFGIMKLNDPGSTVREGEYATAQNAASVPEALRARYNSVINGQKLTPAQRADFLNTGQKLYEGQKVKYDQVKDQYSQIAQRQGLDPRNVIIDVGYKAGVAPAATSFNVNAFAERDAALKLPAGTSKQQYDAKLASMGQLR